MNGEFLTGTYIELITTYYKFHRKDKIHNHNNKYILKYNYEVQQKYF